MNAQNERTSGHKQGEHDNHAEMILKMREKWLWTNFMIMMLGAWLISSPFTFDYKSNLLDWSDIISGLLLVIFSGLALFPALDFFGRWAVCFIGIWLEFAPLIFWSPTGISYLNDTLVGVLVIVFSVLVPSMPGMAHHMKMMQPGPEVPTGWSYNPSSWHQRAPMITLAFIGWLIARYLTAFQMGYIQTIWEPFFGDGTVKVLTSKVSHKWPISDAGLGALAYTFEMLMGWMGAKIRWRTMPWMVAFFFILVVPLGVVSIVLVMLQPVSVGHWCTLCLLTAFLMLIMIPLTVDEVVATGQFLLESFRKGKPFWRTFWIGGTLENREKDERTPAYGAPLGKMIASMVCGVSIPWNLALSTLLGVWIMASPAVFGMSGHAADSNHVIGALIVTVSVIVMGEVIRTGRFLNVIFGIWLMAAPWILNETSVKADWNNVVIGLLLILLSFPRGPIRERYGSWNRYIV